MMLKPALQSRNAPTTGEGAAIAPRSAVASSDAALESISLRFVVTTMNCDYCDTAHPSLIEHLLFTMHCDEYWENKLDHISYVPYLYGAIT